MHDSYLERVWKRFQKHSLGMIGLILFSIFLIAGIYAPFLSSGMPLIIKYDGIFYFPLFRYLFFSGYYTKTIDIFFNLLMFTLPLFLLAAFVLKSSAFKSFTLFLIMFFQFFLFIFILVKGVRDPASDFRLTSSKLESLNESERTWEFELAHMNEYKKMLLVYSEWLNEMRNKALSKYKKPYFDSLDKKSKETVFPTLYEKKHLQEKRLMKTYQKILKSGDRKNLLYGQADSQLRYLEEKRKWLDEKKSKISYVLMPLFSHFHWEENAGGSQNLNQVVDWQFLTRINRKDLTAALIFGIRISLVVGITATILSLIIGIPIGGLAGYFGGRVDIIVSRLLEIWEAMPAFFMLLMIVAILQSKSIFLIISVIGLFGWTSISRYIRAEFFKQRNLSYVEACKVTGFSNSRIIFSHILPNAIPPVLTLLPFAVMGAITSEAALSFLGLGEEGSSSWGVLMDEGRSAFPGESYLLWPPAILLTLLLISIALIGDALRDTLDPKLLR